MPQAEEVVNDGQQQGNNEGAKPVEQPANSQQKPDAQKQGTPEPTPGNKGGKPDPREAGFIADLQKERTARQGLEQQIKDLTGTLERERKRIRLMFDDDPKTAEEQEAAAIREQFAKVFPHLAKLTDEQIDKLIAGSESAGSAQQVVDHHWTQHARQTLDNVLTAVTEAQGLDELSPRLSKRVEDLFISWVESDEAVLKRYMAGDKKLVEEFVASYTEDFVTPARRQTTNDEVKRFRPVPRGGDRNVRATPAKKIDFNDTKAVEDAMVESFKEHGGRFSR